MTTTAVLKLRHEKKGKKEFVSSYSTFLYIVHFTYITYTTSFSGILWQMTGELAPPPSTNIQCGRKKKVLLAGRKLSYDSKVR